MPKLAEKFISDNGANIYDKVKITNKEQTLEGIIMPRNNFSGDHIIVLKLDNGYNIGISAEGAELNIIEKAKEKSKNNLKNEKNQMSTLVEKCNENNLCKKVGSCGIKALIPLKKGLLGACFVLLIIAFIFLIPVCDSVITTKPKQSRRQKLQL